MELLVVVAGIVVGAVVAGAVVAGAVVAGAVVAVVVAVVASGRVVLAGKASPLMGHVPLTGFSLWRHW